jgi:hypothetical protein
LYTVHRVVNRPRWPEVGNGEHPKQAGRDRGILRDLGGAAHTPTPLSRQGQLEEDRLLGEVAIGLLVTDKPKDTTSRSPGKPDEMLALLQAILARIEAKRKSAPSSPALESSAVSIRKQIAKRLDAAFPTDPFAR